MGLALVINRLDGHINDFMNNKNINSARKAGEAICKIILGDTNSAIDTNVKYDQLISLLNTKNTNLPKFFLSKIQAELRVLQSYGNADSHDSEEALNTNDLVRIQRAIIGLLGYLFDSKDDYSLDYKIPDFIYGLLNESSNGNENWRCQQIISTIYPNRNVIKNIKDKDFEFHVVEDADGRHIAFLGISRNVSFTDVFTKSLSSENLGKTDSLTFLFPLEISKATGTPVKNRKEYIQKKSNTFLPKDKNIKVSYYFYEDYIWDKCLPAHIKSNSDIALRSDFIDQNLFNKDEVHMSLDYVDSLIYDYRLDKKPLHVIFGQGGVGKTTFCEQAVQRINSKMNDGLKKKAIFISSIDINDDNLSTMSEISTIEDLYSLVFNSDEDTKIEKNSLGLNISCGNLIIIIDGLDELISKLKDKFNVDGFFESIHNLNDTYSNCTIIITSREISLDKLDHQNSNILHLKGFDDSLIIKYLSKRFKSDNNLLDKAYKNIKSISASGEITPLIIRLVSDLTNEDGSGINKFIECPYLDKEQAMDKVVLLLIGREIQKQVLDMDGSQYFMLLQSIIFEHQGRINESEFCDQVQYILQTGKANRVYNFTKEFYDSYLVSSLLSRDGEDIYIKYDSIEFLIKVRYLTHVINSEDNHKNDTTINSALIQDCFKGGVLIEEISKFKKNDTTFEKERLTYLINLAEESPSNRKLISALLYLYFSTKKDDRVANSEHLISLFNSEKLSKLSIFGDFYPLDFTNITVDDGYFDNFSSLGKSLIPRGKTIFNKCKFVNFNKKDIRKGSVYPENFNSDCDLCDGIKIAMDIAVEADVKKQGLIEDDLIKIFKVGFRNGSFIWKSIDVYKQQCSSLKTKYSLMHLLDQIEGAGFLVKEEARASSLFGYKVNVGRIQEVKDFVTQRIISASVSNLIEKLDS
ncbi:NACHT domain-containing protein [Enterobacter hormaechei subsp. steigerwaltii]